MGLFFRWSAIDQLSGPPTIGILDSLCSRSPRRPGNNDCRVYFGSLTPVGMPRAIELAVPCAFFAPTRAHPDHMVRNRLSVVLTVATPTV